MDYHIIGFRECASEVARYLVTIEGMDIQDPLRLRLMSHLQCFVAQRELSAKSTVAGVPSSNWSSFQPNYTGQGYQVPYAGASPVTPHQQHNNQLQNNFNSSYLSASASSSSAYINTSITPQSPDYASSGYGTANSTATNVSSSNNASTTSPTPNHPPTATEQLQLSESQQPIYTDLSNSSDRLVSLGGNYHHYPNSNQLYSGGNNNSYTNNNNNNNNNSKPYRPWHPEMAYWTWLWLTSYKRALSPIFIKVKVPLYIIKRTEK